MVRLQQALPCLTLHWVSGSMTDSRDVCSGAKLTAPHTHRWGVGYNPHPQTLPNAHTPPVCWSSEPLPPALLLPPNRPAAAAFGV